MEYLVSVFMIVVLWFVFVKAERPGWAAIIPFYHSYLANEIAGLKVIWFIIGMSCAIISSILLTFGIIMTIGGLSHDIPTIGTGTSVIGIMMIIVGFLISILPMIWWALIANGIAKAFGQSTGFAVGIFFLSPVFLAIIAWSSDIKYIGDGGNSANKYTPTPVITPPVTAPSSVTPTQSIEIESVAINSSEDNEEN